MAEKIKKKYRFLEIALTNFWGRVIGILLSFAGISGCDFEPGPCMYGSPWAEFTVTGTVMSNTDSTPIPKICITLSENGEETGYSVETDENGKFNVLFGSASPEEHILVIKAQDVDGTENGEFTTTETSVTILKSDYVEQGDNENGYSSWNGSKTVDISLEEK